jgi:hypothetical protein
MESQQIWGCPELIQKRASTSLSADYLLHLAPDLHIVEQHVEEQGKHTSSNGDGPMCPSLDVSFGSIL